jgi:hypothetical protein
VNCLNHYCDMKIQFVQFYGSGSIGSNKIDQLLDKD